MTSTEKMRLGRGMYHVGINEKLVDVARGSAFHCNHDERVSSVAVEYTAERASNTETE